MSGWLGVGVVLSLATSGCSLLAPDDAYFSGGSKGDAGAGDAGVVGPRCDPLPAASGAVIDVGPSQAAELAAIVAGAAPGTTVSLAAGTYALGSTLVLGTSGVALRSAGDDAGAVVLDGGGSLAVGVRLAASDAVVAHVTITGTTDAGVEVTPASAATTGTRVYGVELVDAGQHYVRAVPSAGGAYADSGRIECSVLRMTDATRAAACCTGCAPLGVDVVGGRGWQLRASRIEGFYCDPGPLPFGALFAGGARDTLVENCVFLRCGRGLGLGVVDGAASRTYPDAPYGGVVLDHIDGLVRNNVVFGGGPEHDTGIEVNDAREPRLFHNTVVTGPAATGAYRSIDWRYPDTRVVVRNNLTTNIGARDGAQGDVADNLEQTPVGIFVDATAGDFHLQASATDAIDRGQPVAESGLDIDGQTHDLGAAPDLGVDERSP